MYNAGVTEVVAGALATQSNGHVRHVEFACDAKEMANALKVLSLAIPPKNSALYSTLSAVRVEAKGNKAALYATDLEIGLGVEIEADVKRQGIFLVQLESLKAILAKSRRSARATISTDGKAMTMAMDAYDLEVSLPLLPYEDYPELIMPHPDAKTILSTSLSNLARACELVEFAALDKKNDIKHKLYNVLLEARKDGVHVVAADGYRIGIASLKDQVIAEDRLTFPRSLAKAIVRAHGTFKQVYPVAVKRDDERLYIIADGMTFWGRLGGTGESAYPLWRMVVPECSKTTIAMKRKELVSALEKMIPVTPESGGVIFDLYSDFHLKVFSEDLINGKSEAYIPYEIRRPAEFRGKIQINAEYLLEPLKRLEADMVTIRLTDSNQALVLEPDDKNSWYCYVCMPIALRG